MTKEEPKQIKCYCGHTNYCDCSPLEELKQETLEDAIYQNIGLAANEQGIINQALATANVMKVLEERMYSEEDMIEFAEFVATYPDKNKNVNGEMLHAKSKYDGAERTIDLLETFKSE